MFTIVPRGRGLLLVTQECVSPAPFAEFRLHTSDNTKSDFVEFLPFEAMLELTKRGWYYTQQTASRRLPAYRAGTEKRWFFHKTICGYYLRVLLVSEKLFTLGLRDIYHFQASTYYRTLLYMMRHPHHLNDVKPWQSHAYYKVLQQQAEKRGTHTHTARARIVGGDFEPDHIGGTMSRHQVTAHYTWVVRVVLQTSNHSNQVTSNLVSLSLLYYLLVEFQCLLYWTDCMHCCESISFKLRQRILNHH